MGTPKVSISRANGAIGTTPANTDGETLMVFAAVTGNLPWHTGLPGVYTTYESFKNKINDTYLADKIARLQIELHVRHFFLNSNGQKLHILLVPQTETYGSILVGTTGSTIINYIKAQNGAIKLLGLFINPAAIPTYTADFTPTGFAAAVSSMNTWAKFMAIDGYPLHIFVGFRPATMSTATLKPRFLNSPMVTLVAYRHQEEYQAAVAEWASITGPTTTESEVLKIQAHLGYVLGVVAGLPVQRNLARVANGALNLGGQAIVSDSLWSLSEDQVVDNGWLVARQHVGLPGHYFNDDVTSTDLSDDFAWIHRNRIANKAQSLAKRVYLQKLNSEVSIDPSTGRLSPIEAKSLEQLLIQAVEAEMVQKGELVACNAYIDPTQDVLTTSTINVVLKLLPYGHAKYINVVVSFTKSI